MAVSDKYIQQEVRGELVRLLFANAIITNVAVIFAVVVTGVILNYLTPSGLILAWISGMTTLSAIRLCIVKLYNVASSTRKTYQPYILYYTVVTAFIGLGWGLLPWLLLGDFSANIQVFIVISMVVFVHIGMHALAADRLAQILYISPLPLSVALRFFSGGQEFFVLLGVVAIFYLVVMIAIGGKAHSSLLVTLQLQFQNKQLIANLEQAMAEAEGASRAKSEFLAAMSHEIRTPLNGVLGVGDLLLKSSLSVKQRKLATIMRESGKTLLYILNDILDISKIEAGKLELDSVNFNVKELLNGTCALFSGKAGNKELVLENHIDSEVPQVLYGDPLRLRQILSNLIDNAIKFTAQGLISVRIEAEANNFSAALKISVEDSGIGLSQEQHVHIFDSFVQADSSTTKDYGGTGLGLAICSQLVQLMGGKIGVESELEKGARFWFTVELGIPEIKEFVETPIISDIGSDGHVLPQFDTHVLVAEDNPTNQIVAEGMLTYFGCQVDLVSDGHEAVVAASNYHFDLIFMDCQMPKLDGYEATRKIRKNQSLSGVKSTPIVALTAQAMKSDRDQCLRAGMNDYLSKPFDERQLVEILNRWLPDKAVVPPKNIPAQSLKKEGISMHVNSAALAMLDQIQLPGKPDIMNRVIAIYLKETPPALANIDESLKLNDSESLWISAHKMKSSNGQIGAKRMAEICVELETMGRENNVDKGKSRKLFIELEQEFVYVAEELRHIKEQRKNSVNG